MGLDSVELVMRIEKSFGINIPDPVAEKISTVNDMHEVVWERINDNPSDQCLFQLLYFRLRNFFTNYGYNPAHFTPNTLIQDILIPEPAIKHAQAHLPAILGLDKPGIEKQCASVLRSSATVKELVEGLLSIDVGSLIKEHGVSKQEMKKIIDHIISDQSGVPPEEIQPHKRFTDDLGMD